VVEDTDFGDDSSIPFDEILLRRIPGSWTVWDDNKNDVRPSSQAFSDHPDGTPMSVFLAGELTAAGQRPETILAGHDGFSLVSISVGLVRDLGLTVRRRPLPNTVGHAEVCGKKTTRIRKELAREALWVVRPLHFP